MEKLFALTLFMISFLVVANEDLLGTYINTSVRRAEVPTVIVLKEHGRTYISYNRCSYMSELWGFYKIEGDKVVLLDESKKRQIGQLSIEENGSFKVDIIDLGNICAPNSNNVFVPLEKLKELWEIYDKTSGE